MVIECPNCKSQETTYIEAVSLECGNSLIHRGTGSIYPQVCLNCGVVYINKDELEQMRRTCEKRNEE